MIGGYIVMKVLLLIFGRFLQSYWMIDLDPCKLYTAIMMAFSHGSNDAQKAMGDYYLNIT